MRHSKLAKALIYIACFIIPGGSIVLAVLIMKGYL